MPVKARKILGAVDISDESAAGRRRMRAVRQASTTLARGLGTGLDLLYVCDPSSLRPLEDIGLKGVETWREACITGIQTLGHYSKDTRPIVKFGSPPERILQALNGGHGQEMLVVATRGRTGVQRLVLGSVAEEVIQSSRRPVLVLGPQCRQGLGFSEILGKPDFLLATDFGRNSRPAETYAGELARRLGAHVSIVHDPLSGSYSYEHRMSDLLTEAGAGRLPPSALKVLGLKMLRMKKRYLHDHKVEAGGTLIQNGHDLPGALCREAAKGRALIIMGTHGHKSLFSSFFGSVVRETILRSPVPVLVIHSV